MKTLRDYIESIEQINNIVEAVGPTIAAAQGQDPTNPLNKTSGQAAQPAAAAPATNPYDSNPAQAAIYAKLTPQDQAWATQGGGRPDLTDPFILSRMPNKGQQTAAPAAQPAAPVAQAAQPAKATWPATRDEIIAFQASHKDAEGKPLKQDGLIGQRTMAALQAAGATPPAGFKPVANKPVAAAPTPAAPTGQGAQPVKTASPTQSSYNAMLAAKEKLDAAKSQDAWYLPTSAATQSTIDRAQQDYDAAQQAHFKASSQATVDPQAAARQNQIKALQAQMAKTTDPTQKQSIQTAINTLQGNFPAGRPGSPSANLAARSAAQTQQAAQPVKESVGYSEDQSLARIVNLARR